MSSLDLYQVFHGNLQFSSIPKNKYRSVINNCYWPLIRIIEKNRKLKLGIEFSGLTLLEIKKNDNKLLEKINKLIKEGKLEFIGSSYTQAIFPLIPYEINLKNLKLGIEIYKKILSLVPEIFYVNEQTFSDGIIGVYKKAGVKNIIIDFDSTPEDVRLNKSLLYKPAKIISQHGEKLNVIWSSSIAFQKFQRHIFDEMSLEDYQKYLLSHLSKVENRYFPLYVGDWEIFGYSPKGISRNFNNDYKRMGQFLEKLTEEKKINFILPKQALANKIRNEIKLIDPSSPISSKKQEKYNVLRWALAGKNTIFRNTDCFRLHQSINTLKKKRLANKSIIESLEVNLIKLWGSDYRTNTTDDKNREYNDLLTKTQKTIKNYMNKAYNFQDIKLDDTNLKNKYQVTTKESWATESVNLTLDWRKGISIKELIFPKIFPKKIAGLVAHGYFQNQQLASDWFTGHCLFETDKDNKYTDLYPAKIFIKKNNNGDINLFSKIKTPIGTIRKNYKVYQALPRVDLQYVFNFRKVEFKSARIGNITLDPTNFDNKNLWYATVNGGKSKELFKIGKTDIAQDELVSLRISSHGCLGATNGWVAVGDNKKGLAIIWGKAQIASCPIIHFEKTPQGLFARIQPSIAESDETGFPIYEGIFSFGITYLGLKSLHELDRFNFPTK